MLTREPVPTSPVPTNHHPGTQTVASKDGTVLAYDRIGHGPPVILVVGALCSRTMGPGVKLAPALAERFSVITYDRRGRGESGDRAPYAVDREIDDLEALVSVAGGTAAVFGHSSGAVLALQAAARGVPITKLALYEPPLIVDDAKSPTEADWAQIDALVAEDRRADAARMFLRTVGVPGFVVGIMRWLPVWRQILAVAHTLPYDGAITRGLQRGTPLPDGLWTGVTTPTLAMCGGKSPPWMRHGTGALVARLPSATLRIVEGENHDVSAKVIGPVLTDFFRSEGR